MNQPKRPPALGRGLGALIPQVPQVAPPVEGPAAPAGPVLRLLPIELVVPNPEQPRKHFEPALLRELADSVKLHGIIQPVVVSPHPHDPGHYILIAGERRWRAAQLAGLREVPAVIRDLPDRAAIAVALIENIQRENLNPLEEAAALHRLITEFELTHQQAAEAVGRSRATISNLLRLLDLSEDVQRLVRERKLDMGHARALLPLPPVLQREAALQVQLRGLSARETEQLVRRLQQDDPAESSPVKLPDPDIHRFENDLAERLGARVRVRHGASGKGSVVIHYNSLDELDGILSRVK